MSSLTLNQVTELLTSQFINAWNDQTVYTLDNEAFSPPDNAPWVRFVIRNKIGHQWTLGQPGNRIYQREAMIFGQIFTPTPGGRQQADMLAQTFKDIFEGMTFGEVQCLDGTMRETMDPDGLWFSIVVQIDFNYNETK